MKLVRYGAIGQEKPGLIDKSGQLRDLSAQVKDLNGEAYAPASLAKLAGLDAAKLPAVDGKPRFGAPVTGISKFVAIGLNYVDHAKETGNPIPPEPIFFLKANTSLSGPNDAVEKPRGSTKLDWEVEIAAIIGTRAKYVSRGRRAQSCRRLLRLQRRLRAQLPAASAADNGPRASRTTPSVRSAPGSSPRTKSPTCRSCRCGSTSTASAARPARPRP